MVHAQVPGLSPTGPTDTVTDSSPEQTTSSGDDAADGQSGGSSDQGADDPTWDLTRLFTDADWNDLVEQNQTFDWMMLLGGIFVGLVAGRVVAFILRRIGQRGENRRWRVAACVVESLASPLALTLLTLGIWFGLLQLTLGPTLRQFTEGVIVLLLAVAASWYVYNLVAVVEVMLSRLLKRTDSDLDEQVVPLIRKALRLFVVIVAVLFIAQNVLGANVTSWLAGLGIVGLAVSLAAQDSLKHVFGSVTILFDRPFRVGELIVWEGQWGVVDSIGFRSTRVRTLEGHLLTVPNGNIVNTTVQNVGRRPYIRRIINVTITYDTPPDKVREAVDTINAILKRDGIREAIHDPDEPDNPDNLPPRVFFNDFNAASLNIVVYYWHRPPDWWAYLEHAQRFNDELLRRFNEQGIDFAFPTQTLYLAGDENRPLRVGVDQPEGQA